MEKFDEKGYRNQLAEDLSNIDSHSERKEVLESESNSRRYEVARERHFEDIQDYLEGRSLEAKERLSIIILSQLGDNDFSRWLLDKMPGCCLGCNSGWEKQSIPEEAKKAFELIFPNRDIKAGIPEIEKDKSNNLARKVGLPNTQLVRIGSDGYCSSINSLLSQLEKNLDSNPPRELLQRRAGDAAKLLKEYKDKYNIEVE